MTRIVIDAMGGDSTEEVVKGAFTALKNIPDISISLVGDKSVIESIAKRENAVFSSLDIISASDVISNEESPTIAIKTKKDSSMVKSFYLLKEDPDAIGMISAGNSGAVLTGGSLIIGRLPGVYRPTLLAQLPTATGGSVCIADSGANVDCHAEWLYQFAVMGSTYMSAITNIERPTVALLSVGPEEHKGNALIRAAYPLLKSSNLNFVGNMEARDALLGNFDVIVCDGYCGNILVKSSEGAAKAIMKMLKANVKASFSAKFGYLFMKKALLKLKNQMDFNNYGGGAFLGIKKCVIKAHGASTATAIYNSTKQILKIHNGKVIDIIKREVSELK